MDDITSLRVFLEVARRQSFSETADYFGISRSAVSKQVAALEVACKAKLLVRTTKNMHLTRAGMEVVRKAPEVLQGLDELLETVVGLTGDITGLVRVGASPYFGAQKLTPMLAAFCKQHPDIEVAISLLSRHRLDDFVEEGLDIGVIVSTALPDMSHSAYTLASMPQVLVASPEYLESIAPINRPEDLAGVNCLINTYKSPQSVWRFSGADGEIAVKVKGTLRSSYADALKVAAVNGMGVGVHPNYMVEAELASGKLVSMLKDFQPETLRVHALYAGRGQIPKRIRAVIDAMRTWDWKL